LVVIRLVVAAGALVAVSFAADARPVWRQVPTPLPPVVHMTKVRPPYIGPVWRFAPIVAVDGTEENSATSVAEETESLPAPATEIAVASTPEPPPVVAEAKAAPVEQAAPVPAVEPVPTPIVAAEPEPPVEAKPAPVVVAQKAPEPPPGPVAKPAPVAAPAVAPTVAEPPASGAPWLDYLGVFALAAVVAGTIFFFARERRRPA
jgi:outer membrane biosynthesis protein TonB